MVQIEDVRAFWDASPLWTGEGRHPAGSLEFFEEQREVVIADTLGGEMDERFFSKARGRVLDLGCGIGLWVVEFAKRGFLDVTGADISPRSLEMAKQRCQVYGIDADLREENAEALSFPDATFDHVNCLGVIHHTISPPAAAREIHRVLKPGGTAVVAVYYRNIVLRHFGLFSPVIRLLSAAGARGDVVASASTQRRMPPRSFGYTMARGIRSASPTTAASSKPSSARVSKSKKSSSTSSRPGACR